MNDEKEVQVVHGLAPVQPKKSLGQKLALAAGTAYAVTLTAPAHAAGMFDSIYANFNTEMDAAKSNMISMWGAAGLVLIGFAIWRYTKRGANSA